MTLENLRNLEKIGQLKSHVTSREEVIHCETSFTLNRVYDLC